MVPATDGPTRFTRVARVAAAVLVATLPVLTSTALPATATAAPAPVAGASAATGFDSDLSFVVSPDPPVPVTNDIGSVTAPPDSSVTLTGAQTAISVDLAGVIGVLPIAQALSIDSTAVSGPGTAAAQSTVVNPDITVAGDVLGFTQANTSVECLIGQKPGGTITAPTSYSLNGTPFQLDPDGITEVTLTSGTATITTPPIVLTDNTANAAALTVSISVTTATYTETGILTLAGSSCATPAAPILQAVSPTSGPASGGSTVTLTGTGFVPNQTTVNIGSAQGQNVSVTPDGTSLTFTLPAGQAGTVQVSVTTPAGTSKQFPFEYRDPITTSGFLRDADTAAPLGEGCVIWRPAGSLDSNQIAWVNGDGSWSFQSSSPGPFDIGFYIRTDNNCNSAIGTSYLPSWYLGKPMTGNDPAKVTPADGASQVKAGSSTEACLSKTALVVTCAEPAVLSGRVTVPGGGPAPYTCVFALGPSGEGQLSVADAGGNWTATGLPNNMQFIVGFIAAFGPPEQPCQFDGPPPTPPAGALQPVFYRNVWVDLATLTADDSQVNAYDWAIEHGAQLVPGNSANIDACLSTVAGSVVPRPDCLNPPPTSSSPASTQTVTADPTTASATSTATVTVTAATTSWAAAAAVVTPTQSLAATGVPVAAYGWTGSGLIVAGILLIALAVRRHPRLH